MNKVWVILEYYCEDTTIVGIFDSELKAIMAADKLQSLVKKMTPGGFPISKFYDVEQYDVK